VANAGRCVVNSVVRSVSSDPGGSTAVRNSPSIVSAVDVTAVTFPAATWSVK